MRKRAEKTPWEKLLHEIVLETLGLRRNREPMAKMALKFSPSAMVLAGADTLYKAGAGTWKLSGVRPAGHPRARLAQYVSLLEKNPSWSQDLREAEREFPPDSFSRDFEDSEEFLLGKTFRAQAKIPFLHKLFADSIFKKTIGGTRLETLICDAVLPLFAACSPARNFFPYWYHWFLGDAPAKTLPVLREAGLVSRERPICNGAFQGLFQTLLAR